MITSVENVVKKILYEYDWEGNTKYDIIENSNVIERLCSLYKQKSEITGYSLPSDAYDKYFTKPDPSRLLTIDEEHEMRLAWEKLDPATRISWRDYWLEAQRDLTASIYQQKIREIVWQVIKEKLLNEN